MHVLQDEYVTCAQDERHHAAPFNQPTGRSWLLCDGVKNTHVHALQMWVELVDWIVLQLHVNVTRMQELDISRLCEQFEGHNGLRSQHLLWRAQGEEKLWPNVSPFDFINGIQYYTLKLRTALLLIIVSFQLNSSFVICCCCNVYVSSVPKYFIYNPLYTLIILIIGVAPDKWLSTISVLASETKRGFLNVSAAETL